MILPYYEDGTVQLYLGDMREILLALNLQADLIVADPPYAETSLPWDRWPDGWPTLAATVTSSMWCFGSMRMFLDRRDEFSDWKLSQDVVWEKQQGSGFVADRFNRVHEHATHWYRGQWKSIHHDTPRTGLRAGARVSSRSAVGKATHGECGASPDVRDGTRLARSVIQVRNLNGRSLHPTEKPIGILDPLIRYACPPGGLVLDPFAGSGSTLDAARQTGRRAIGIERHEPYAEAAARRLDALTLPLEGGAA
jgi:site-specific DNA-methyltransferase (adenine-specific)